MLMVLLVIIGIPVLCVVGYAAFDKAMIESDKRSRKRKAYAEQVRYENEREIYRRETLDKANALVSKYLESQLTLLLIDEIKKMSDGNYIHAINLNRNFGFLAVRGGSQHTMYIGDIHELGETSRFMSLGYRLPEGEDYNINAVALMTAIAKKLGSDYKIDITYDYDNDICINDVAIFKQSLKLERELKSPI